MKINNTGVKSSQTAQVQGRDLNKEVSNKKDAKGTSTADLLSSSSVKMSEQAQMASKAKAIASKETIDEAKVARLQKLIDEGKYKVDAASVADRLVDEHLLSGD